MKRRFFRKKFVYKCGRIKIISEIKLSDAQVDKIFKTTDDLNKYGHYYCYYVARITYHEVGHLVKKVEAYYKWGRFYIKITKKTE